MLPLDVYLENESEVEQKSVGGIVNGNDFGATIGAKLLRKDGKSKVVVNFHGASSSFSVYDEYRDLTYVRMPDM